MLLDTPKIAKDNSSLNLLRSNDFSKELRTASLHIKIIDDIMVGEYYPPHNCMDLDFTKLIVKQRAGGHPE